MFVTACWTILACVVLDMATCTCHSGFGFETPKPAPASRGRAVAHWCLLWCALDCFGGLWLRDFDCASYANFFSRCLGWSGQGDFSARRGTVQAGASGASLKSFSLWNEDKWIVYECLWYVSEMNEMNEAWIVSQNALAESHVFFHFIIYIYILSSCCRLKKLWWTCSRSFSVGGYGVPTCISCIDLWCFSTGTQCPGLLLAPVPALFNLGHHSALFDRWLDDLTGIHLTYT